MSRRLIIEVGFDKELMEIKENGKYDRWRMGKQIAVGEDGVYP